MRRILGSHASARQIDTQQLTSRLVVLALIVFFAFASAAFGDANGKLQLHFIDVGQGDAVLLISPNGETVLFDNGVAKYCDMPVSYLQQLGVTKINYHIASHYHDDHIGCTTEVLGAFPLTVAAYDRGASYPSEIYRKYAKAVGDKRKTVIPGDKITLDASTPSPVTVQFVASNGDGFTTTNENDLSVVAAVRFGKFDAVMGGDLSGVNANSYKDIESSVAGKVGQVEVYKVHHHCSRYSTNDVWLSTTKPRVGVISASGTIGKNYNHPTEECLERLHKAGVKTYWTERANGADPEPDWDVVAGNVLVEAEAGNDEFTVTYNWARTDTYPTWEAGTTTTGTTASYAWSRKSKVYHYESCKYVSNISPANLEKGGTAPDGKMLHENCPLH